MMGRPEGLNLRNLCWHGFVQHTEVPIVLVWTWPDPLPIQLRRGTGQGTNARLLPCHQKLEVCNIPVDFPHLSPDPFLHSGLVKSLATPRLLLCMYVFEYVCMLACMIFVFTCCCCCCCCLFSPMICHISHIQVGCVPACGGCQPGEAVAFLCPRWPLCC